jgi:hypothetical protein
LIEQLRSPAHPSSSGREFKLWIPPKNQFIVGNNEVARPSTQPLKNLRPQVIYDALLLQPVDLHKELALLEAGEQLYDEYREFNGVLFPTNIRIWRPQEEYAIKLEVTKLTINGPIYG